MVRGVPWPCCDTAKEMSSWISAASCPLPPRFTELMPCSSCLKRASFGGRASGCWLHRSSWLLQGAGTATGVREGNFHTRDVPGVVVYALLFCVFSLLFQLGCVMFAKPLLWPVSDFGVSLQV